MSADPTNDTISFPEAPSTGPDKSTSDTTEPGGAAAPAPGAVAESSPENAAIPAPPPAPDFVAAPAAPNPMVETGGPKNQVKDMVARFESGNVNKPDADNKEDKEDKEEEKDSEKNDKEGKEDKEEKEENPFKQFVNDITKAIEGIKAGREAGMLDKLFGPKKSGNTDEKANQNDKSDKKELTEAEKDPLGFALKSTAKLVLNLTKVIPGLKNASQQGLDALNKDGANTAAGDSPKPAAGKSAEQDPMGAGLKTAAKLALNLTKLIPGLGKTSKDMLKALDGKDEKSPAMKDAGGASPSMGGAMKMASPMMLKKLAGAAARFNDKGPGDFLSRGGEGASNTGGGTPSLKSVAAVATAGANVMTGGALGQVKGMMGKFEGMAAGAKSSAKTSPTPKPEAKKPEENSSESTAPKPKGPGRGPGK